MEGEAAVFAALGDPVRLRLVARLGSEGPLSATVLAGEQPTTRQAVSHHLGVLHRAGLVRKERHRNEVRYALEGEQLRAARAFLDAVGAGWDRTLARLRDHVEAE